jgi:hypothetical protein
MNTIAGYTLVLSPLFSVRFVSDSHFSFPLNSLSWLLIHTRERAGESSDHLVIKFATNLQLMGGKKERETFAERK